jgi:outer membrane protein OmpA-like peptidoglycan-associated protein
LAYARAERVAGAEAAAAAERERAAVAAAEAARLAQTTAEAAARVAAQEAEVRMRAQARAELLNRLSMVLPTHETERGLVSEIGGVQFATGTANLNMPARESLARFSGIVASYPELRFRIEGHTDNVGSDQTNSELSLRRALSVRDYLIGLGVPATSIGVEGYGSARPVSDNTTPGGRARNRRVEIVISGGMLVAGNR